MHVAAALKKIMETAKSGDDDSLIDWIAPFEESDNYEIHIILPIYDYYFFPYHTFFTKTISHPINFNDPRQNNNRNKMTK